MSQKDNFEAMLSFLLEYAQIMLRDEGDFYPFGAGMSPEGDMLAANTETASETPAPHEVIASLHTVLSRQAARGEIDTAGICMDVDIRPPDSEESTAAICVELEHRDGEALEVYLPYSLDEKGTVTYGEMFALPGEQVIFLPVAS